MKNSSGTLDLSLLSLHWATLHVLPGILRPGPLCCPELSSQPWHWAAWSALAKFQKRIRHARGVEKPGSKRYKQTVLRPTKSSPPHTHTHALLPGEGPGGGGQEHTHPKPTPRAPGRHSTSWLPKASALLAQRLRNPRGFPRPGVTTAAAARASRAPHPFCPMLGTRGHRAVASPAPWAPRSPALAPRHPAPSRCAALGDSPALGLKRRPPRARGRRRRGRRAARGSWHSGRRAPGAAEPRTRPEI